MHLKPQPPDEDHQALYQEFLTFMKGGDRKKTFNLTTEMKYKALHSEIRKQLQSKKQKIEMTKNREQKIKQTGCKFHRIEGHKSFDLLKKSYVQDTSNMPVTLNLTNTNNYTGPQTTCQSKIFDFDFQEDLSDQIIMEEFESQELNKQIDNYRKSLGRYKKSIAELKKDIHQIDLKQNKFLEVQHLAENISQFTEQMTNNNFKEFNQMLSQQEETLKNLKNMKNRLKNELYETENQYHLEKRENQAKFKKIQRIDNLEDCKLTGGNFLQNKKNCKPQKQLRKMLEYIEKVLELLEEKQENFYSIKLEQCTKICNKTINIQFLPFYKQWAKTVEEFEKKHELRVQSCDKIIVKLFNQIRQQNAQIQKKIHQKKYLVEESTEQYESLHKKLEELKLLHGKGDLQQNQEELNRQICKKSQVVHKNSILFIKTFELVNTVLMRFRYIFKIFIMMNIDKKKLNNQLLKLDDVLDTKGHWYGANCKVEENGISTSNQFRYAEDTNAVEILAEAKRMFPELDGNKISDIINLLFNDMRASLICRKNLILEELMDCNDRGSWEQFIKSLQIIREECEYNYTEKIKICFQTLLECLKSVTKGNQSCFPLKTNQPSFPLTMFQKVKYNTGFSEEEEEIQNAPLSGQWVLQFIMNQQNKYKPEQWGQQEKKNPTQMIRKLQAIRNESTQKFKLIDCNFNPRRFIQDRKENESVRESFMMRKTSKNEKIASQSVKKNQLKRIFTEKSLKVNNFLK